jgi:membrane associated rhomboid family serine protease
LKKEELNILLNALIYPAFFVVLLGGVHFVQYGFDLNFVHFGVFPRKLTGLIGIATSPLIHGDFSHLFNNSIPLLILGSALFFFYKEIALKVTLWIYLMVGVWTWVYAREAYHIGASGLLYGLFSFLLVSGFIRRHTQLISLSFVVIFLYGSLVWGILPIDVKISFEGHLWGFVAGIILAIYYRKQGPQRKEHEWAEDDQLEDENAYWNENKPNTDTHQEINYQFKPKDKEG